MKPRFIAIAIVIAVGTSLFWGIRLGHTETQPGINQEGQLEELLTERRDTLRQLVRIVNMRHEVGEAQLSDVIDAQDKLLQANLDLEESPDKRLELHQQRVDLLLKLEESLKKQYEQGITTLETTLLAKSARLEAQIELQREKSGSPE